MINVIRNNRANLIAVKIVNPCLAKRVKVVWLFQK